MYCTFYLQHQCGDELLRGGDQGSGGHKRRGLGSARPGDVRHRSIHLHIRTLPWSHGDAVETHAARQQEKLAKDIQGNRRLQYESECAIFMMYAQHVVVCAVKILIIEEFSVSRPQWALLYSLCLCFSPTAIGGALSHDQKLSDHIHWKWAFSLNTSTQGVKLASKFRSHLGP